MSLKSSYDPLLQRLNYRGCVWEQVDHTDTISVEPVVFWVAIFPYQRNFKWQSLTGEVFPDFRDKATMDQIQEKGSHCSDFLVIQPKGWQLVFIFYL